MGNIRKVGLVAAYNFHGWYKNPRILVTFALAFILCFLLSNKVIQFADGRAEQDLVRVVSKVTRRG